ncbi:MAG: PEP-CTERM sorting domain-containing protein [Planctomycetes bacterium]|nr:PEP-CTERM sorting domain-containing protein [Planctomycetota bacterium]
MIVGVCKETFPGERRVALFPEVVPGLAQRGLDVIVESGAGQEAGVLNTAFEAKGARVVPSRYDVFAEADIVVQVRLLGANPNLGFTIDSTGNVVPDPVVLTAADLAAPVENPADYWLVADRASEPYESMLVTLENVTVGQVGGLGKADDNYELWQGTDLAWGTDYFSAPDYDPFYHPGIVEGTELESVTGLVEQYLRSGSGYAWDYYQICTRGAYDVVVPEPGTLALLLLGVVAITRRNNESRRA